MNANELAEQLDEYVGNNGYSHNDYADSMSQASTMLRQQQAEIEALKAKTLTDEEWALLKKVALIAWGTANECSPCAEEFCKQSQSGMLNLLEKTGAELKAMIEKHEATLRKAQEK